MPRKSATNARSDLVAIRMTPKMRFGLELLAKQFDKTLTNTVIYAIEQLFQSEQGFILFPKQGADLRVYALDRVWSPHAHERFALVAIQFPEMLSDEEIYLWSVVSRTGKYWLSGKMPKTSTPEDFNFDALLEDWEGLKKRAKISN